MSALTAEQRARVRDYAENGTMPIERRRDLYAVLDALAAAERERDEAREIVGEYLNPICEAFERVQKIERHPPGSGINDHDYPGPTNDEAEAYDDELMVARNDLTEAIQTACNAREDTAPEREGADG